MNTIKASKIFILLIGFIIIIGYVTIFYRKQLPNYKWKGKSQLNPTNLSMLLTPIEKAAFIQQIVKESLRQFKKNLTKSKQLITTTKAAPKLDVYKFQKLFHHSNKDLNSNIFTRNAKLKPFEIQTTQTERSMMYRLLEIFDRLLSKYGVPYFMYGGTLLGSYRHHDLIPWDDDIDVIVPLTEHDNMLKIFKELEPDYTLYRAGGHDKFYHKSAKKTAYSWKWPYIDVSYYEYNGSYIKDWTRTYGYWYYYPLEIVFPLHRRPLLNLSLPAPKDSFAFLTWTYNYNSPCLMYGYSHMVEGGGPAGTTDCKELKDKFPFVEHRSWKSSNKSGVYEVLRFKDLVINEKVINEPSYAVSETFKLALKPGFVMPKSIRPPNYT